MTVLICPVRKGDSNEELRYAIRSWETNLILETGLQLWTVGYCPTWLNPDRHIEGNAYESMPHAVFDNVLTAAVVADDEGEDEVVFMNDDFFCLDPVGELLPVKRDVSLRSQLSTFPHGVGTWWPRSLLATLDYLAEQGFEDPDSFELHRPLVANPRVMAEVLGAWVDSAGYHLEDIDTVPQWRTVYGVMGKVEAYPARDAKLSAKQRGVGTPWVSTSDQSWRVYSASIRKRFQKPSRWEIQE